MRDLPYFKLWCYKVIPLVYDDSLSYYEVLCKVVTYINELIESDKEIVERIVGDEEQIAGLRSDMTVVQEWINSFNYKPLLETVKEMVDKYVVAGVYFGLTDDGHFVAYIPKTWNKIKFKTTGYDTFLDIQPEFGHLVLTY